jgi:hypothetical protein
VGDLIAKWISVRRQPVCIVLPVLSFIIYVGALFSLPQTRDAPFSIERSSVASAVSNVVYGAPFGTLYSGVLEHFLLHVDAPLQKVFDEMALGEARPGYIMRTIHDGDGSGYIVVATLALRVFGLHSWSLPLLMLGLMGFSTFALLARFRGHVADVVMLYFCGLTTMLFTALVWDPVNSLQVSVGGSRYFTLIAILPAFHLLFEIIEGFKAGRRNDLLLVFQTVILVLSVLVRGSAAPTVGVIALVWLLLLWRRRHEADEVRSLGRQGIKMALAGVGFVGIIILLLPIDYVTEGRFTKTFWELTVVGLGSNPAWPFGNLHEIIDCTRHIPEGLTTGMPDRNGHCFWWDYVYKHHIPVKEAVDGVYGAQYETAMRGTFFRILDLYPRDVLETFLYYKPKRIFSAIFAVIQIKMRGYPSITIGLLVAALVNLLLYFVIVGHLSTSNRILIAKGGFLFAVSTIPGYLLAWASPHTTADLLFYCLFCIGLLLGVIVAAGSRMLPQLMQSTALSSAGKVVAPSSLSLHNRYGTSISYGSAAIDGGGGEG